MAWLAELVDGPLAGETIRIDDDHADTPPPHINVKGGRYRYSGWHSDCPRYRYHGEEGGNGGGRSGRGSRERRIEIATPSTEPRIFRNQVTMPDSPGE